MTIKFKLVAGGLLVLLASILIKPSTALAGNCDPWTSPTVFAVGPNPVNANSEIDFAVEFAPATTNGTLSIVINPNVATGGSDIDTIIPMQIDQAAGRGSAILPGGLPFNGTFHVTVYPTPAIGISPACASVDLVVQNGVDLPPPLPGGCRNWRDPCAVGVTPLCYPNIFFCDSTSNTVKLRTGNEGSGCLADSSGASYCHGNDLFPYTDPLTNECLCYFTREAQLFCDANGNPSPVISSNFTRLTTAIGCVPYDNPQRIVAFLLPWLLGIAGGLGILVIAVGAIQIATSGGDPRKFTGGKELIFSGLTAILMIIFSVWLLSKIGVDILNILNP